MSNETNSAMSKPTKHPEAVTKPQKKNCTKNLSVIIPDSINNRLPKQDCDFADFYAYTINIQDCKGNPSKELFILQEPNIEKYYGSFLYFGKPNSLVQVKKDNTSIRTDFVFKKYKKDVEDVKCFCIDNFIVKNVVGKELYPRLFKISNDEFPLKIKFKLNYIEYMFLKIFKYKQRYTITDDLLPDYDLDYGKLNYDELINYFYVYHTSLKLVEDCDLFEFLNDFYPTNNKMKENDMENFFFDTCNHCTY